MQWGVRRYADAPNGSSEKPRVQLVSRIAGQDLVRFYRPGDQSFGVTYGCRPPSRGIRSAWFTSPSTRPRATGCAPCSRGEEAKRRPGLVEPETFASRRSSRLGREGGPPSAPLSGDELLGTTAPPLSPATASTALPSTGRAAPLCAGAHGDQARASRAERRRGDRAWRRSAAA